ncbi:hypothetical protein BV916_18720 [Pectobacterium odoriferum]|nr:hypothetical protein BV916_18720 [Pectobacterium odoriferum]
MSEKIHIMTILYFPMFVVLPINKNVIYYISFQSLVIYQSRSFNVAPVVMPKDVPINFCLKVLKSMVHILTEHFSITFQCLSIKWPRVNVW